MSEGKTKSFTVSTFANSTKPCKFSHRCSYLCSSKNFIYGNREPWVRKIIITQRTTFLEECYLFFQKVLFREHIYASLELLQFPRSWNLTPLSLETGFNVFHLQPFSPKNFYFAWFGGHIQRCLKFIPGSVLRGLRSPHVHWGLNPGRLHERQAR